MDFEGLLLIYHRDIVSGMDVAEMEESFHGECEEDYHPFKNGGIELDCTWIIW